MKARNLIFFCSLIALTNFSCKKESLDQKLVGKWQILERYNGYTDGGDFQWSAVSTPYQYYIDFKEDGNFIESRPVGWIPAQCSGTYSLNNNQVKINSACYSYPEELNVSISDNNLIITYRVPEGEIRERFIRVE